MQAMTSIFINQYDIQYLVTIPIYHPIYNNKNRFSYLIFKFLGTTYKYARSKGGSMLCEYMCAYLCALQNRKYNALRRQNSLTVSTSNSGIKERGDLDFQVQIEEYKMHYDHKALYVRYKVEYPKYNHTSYKNITFPSEALAPISSFSFCKSLHLFINALPILLLGLKLTAATLSCSSFTFLSFSSTKVWKIKTSLQNQLNLLLNESSSTSRYLTYIVV